MRPAIVFGTRPEIIKCAPLIWAAEEHGLPYATIHTGQHYSVSLSDIFMQEFELPLPKYNLNVGSGSHASQTASIMIGMEAALRTERPDVVLVQGDTNSSMAAALTARKMGIPVAHVEAGLRSGDRDMPEEINRIITDHISDILFAPTTTAQENLMSEGLMRETLTYVTGNTIVDAVMRMYDARRIPPITPPYILATIHRQENTDDQRRLTCIFDALAETGEMRQKNVIAPLHPRTRERLDLGTLGEYVKVIPPVGYQDFLSLEKNADLIITDSGGVQEEACILGVPCITMRTSTERPETIALGANRLVDPTDLGLSMVIDAVIDTFDDNRGWEQPYGGGRAGDTIMKILEEVFE